MNKKLSLGLIAAGVLLAIVGLTYPQDDVLGRIMNPRAVGTSAAVGDLDMAGYDITDAGIVNVDGGRAGTRPLTNATTTTLTVCASDCDSTTIQGAVDMLPYLINNNYIIEVDDGTYAEDVLVQNINGGRISNGGEYAMLTLRGNSVTPTNVEVNSVLVDGAQGAWVTISSMEIQGSNPYTNESSGLEAYGSTQVVFHNIVFAGGINGMTCYNSYCSAAKIDFGTDVLTGNALRVKHNGVIMEQKAELVPTQGNVGGTAYEAQEGVIWFEGGKSTLSGDSGLIGTNVGMVIDADNNTMYGIDTFPVDISVVDDIFITGNENPLLQWMNDDGRIMIPSETTLYIAPDIATGTVAFGRGAAVDAMKYLFEDGRVGIGTDTTPDAILDVDGIGTALPVALFDSQSGSNSVYVTRDGNITQSIEMYVDDEVAYFVSEQDENSGSNGGFTFQLDDDGTANPKYLIERKMGADLFWTNSNYSVFPTTNVGIGTTTPATKLDVYNSAATSTTYIYSGGTGLGGRIILEDYDGAGCTSIVALDGTLTAATVACP